MFSANRKLCPYHTRFLAHIIEEDYTCSVTRLYNLLAVIATQHHALLQVDGILKYMATSDSIPPLFHSGIWNGNHGL